MEAYDLVHHLLPIHGPNPDQSLLDAIQTSSLRKDAIKRYSVNESFLRFLSDPPKIFSHSTLVVMQNSQSITSSLDGNRSDGFSQIEGAQENLHHIGSHIGCQSLEERTAVNKQKFSRMEISFHPPS